VDVRVEPEQGGLVALAFQYVERHECTRATAGMEQYSGHRDALFLRGKGKIVVNVFPFPLKLPHPLSKLFNRKRPKPAKNLGLH
jgi:hypothetical protein